VRVLWRKNMHAGDSSGGFGVGYRRAQELVNGPRESQLVDRATPYGSTALYQVATVRFPGEIAAPLRSVAAQTDKHRVYCWAAEAATLDPTKFLLS